MPQPRRPLPLSLRAFLMGMLTAGLLAACGGGDPEPECRAASAADESSASTSQTHRPADPPRCQSI